MERGAFSVVKEARRKEDGNLYAVKIINKMLLGDSHQEEVIRNEILIMRKIIDDVRNRHIVRMIAFHEEP